MLSMPPDTTMLAEPALMMSCASMVAFMPEPQTLLTVVAPVACEPSLWALKGDNSPMKRPSGVRAADRMTTGSETAMRNSLSSGDLLYYIHHMMRRAIFNGRAESYLAYKLRISRHHPRSGCPADIKIGRASC